MKKNNLKIIAGILWLLVGIMLISRAISWILEIPNGWLIISILLGLLIGFAKYYMVFKKVSLKNINRISSFKEEKISILKLYSPKSYLMIVVMIVGGITLRHLEFIPKYTLFPVYLGIGIAMILGSFLFFRLKKL